MDIKSLKPAGDLNTSGIYALNINDKFYIGSAINLRMRRHSHKKKLNNNYHPNKHMQAAYNKYQTFSFIVIEYCENEELLNREQYWIDKLNVCEIGYNKRKIPNSNLGLKFSVETKAKMSQSSKNANNQRALGRTLSDEEKLKLSIRMKNRKWTPEQIQKRIATRREKYNNWHSEKTRSKISNTLKNKGLEL